MVTPHPRPKEARKEPSRGPTRTTGSAGNMRYERRGRAGILTKGVVDTEVETTVDDDTDDGRNESTVETGETIRRESLSVDVDQAIELAGSSTLGGFGIVGETSTSIIQRVDEEQGRGTSSTTRCNVSSEPLPVAIALLEAEQRLEVVL